MSDVPSKEGAEDLEPEGVVQLARPPLPTSACFLPHGQVKRPLVERGESRVLCCLCFLMQEPQHVDSPGGPGKAPGLKPWRTSAECGNIVGLGTVPSCQVYLVGPLPGGGGVLPGLLGMQLLVALGEHMLPDFMLVQSS